jgi:hypothetical protein
MTHDEFYALPVGEVVYGGGTVWHKISEVNSKFGYYQCWRGEARKGVWTDGAVWTLSKGEVKRVGNTRG